MTDAEHIIEALQRLYPNREIIDLTAPGWRWKVWRSHARHILWDTKAKLIHQLGFHTMIPLEEWDTENGTVQVDGLVCWVCDRRA